MWRPPSYLTASVLGKTRGVYIDDRINVSLHFYGPVASLYISNVSDMHVNVDEAEQCVLCGHMFRTVLRLRGELSKKIAEGKSWSAKILCSRLGGR